MALVNPFGPLALEATLQALIAQLPAELTTGGFFAVELQSGSAQIGVVSIADPMPPLSAGDNTIGGVKLVQGIALKPVEDATTIYDGCDKILADLGGDNGFEVVGPHFASIAATALGDNQIIAAQAGRKIRVHSYDFVCDADVNVKWRSGTNDKTGLQKYKANRGIVKPYSKVGHFETNTGEALNLNLSVAAQVGGSLVASYVT